MPDQNQIKHFFNTATDKGQRQHYCTM